jgi:mRNA interferase YafQ
MKEIAEENKFKKELKLMLKRGRDQEKFWKVIELLINNKPLPLHYRDHKLIGNYIGSRELHIEPDWLLIYRTSDNKLILERTGTHSDLFKKQ